MKSLFSLLLLAIFSSVYAQPDKLGIVEVYGARSVSVAGVRAAIGLKEGDTINRGTFDRAAMEKRIRSVPGIRQANITLVCCDDKEGRSILYAVSAKRMARSILITIK